MRNAVINNFNPMEMRQDIGQLCENFMISERLKQNTIIGRQVNTYFWRTHQQQEIDYLEDAKGKLKGFEFKWKTGKYRIPKIFLKTYPGSEVQLISKNNFQEFIQRPPLFYS